MKQTITITLIIILAIIGLIWWGSKNQKAPVTSTGSRSSLTASEYIYDFGTISMKNGNVTKDFTIKNPTDKDIFLSSVSTSCMCTNAFIISSDGTKKGPFGMSGHGYVPPANETIKANGNIALQIVYNPNAHGPAGVGFIDRFITLVDENGNNLQIEIKATVTP
ncbi:MAG: DUF1573 domain-containing protein [Candidatus Paceibacterota bacterium]|jgi:hypothetical protein